jgi:hypothetical protein
MTLVRAAIAVLLLVLCPTLAAAQVYLAPYILRASASLSGDATHTPAQPDRAPAAVLLRVRVSSVSSFSAALKIQVPEAAAGAGAREICNLATITANGDYLFALGTTSSGPITGSCIGVPPGWQLFLDHGAGSATVAVEAYPVATSSAETTFGIPFGARNVTGANDGLCLAHGHWTGASPTPVACGSADAAQPEYQFVTPPGAVLTVRSVAIVEGATTGSTSAGDGVTFTARFRPLTGSAAAADSGITAEIDLHTPSAAQGGGAAFPSAQVCPYTSQGCRLMLRIDTIDLGATDVDIQALVFVTVT